MFYLCRVLVADGPVWMEPGVFLQARCLIAYEIRSRTFISPRWSCRDVTLRVKGRACREAGRCAGLAGLPVGGVLMGCMAGERWMAFVRCVWRRGRPLFSRTPYTPWLGTLSRFMQGF